MVKVQPPQDRCTMPYQTAAPSHKANGEAPQRWKGNITPLYQVQELSDLFESPAASCRHIVSLYHTYGKTHLCHAYHA